MQALKKVLSKEASKAPINRNLLQLEEDHFLPLAPSVWVSLPSRLKPPMGAAILGLEICACDIMHRAGMFDNLCLMFVRVCFVFAFKI